MTYKGMSAEDLAFLIKIGQIAPTDQAPIPNPKATPTKNDEE
jgi:hypothetical protein